MGIQKKISEEQRICDECCQALRRFQNTVRIGRKTSTEAVGLAFQLLCQQYPELFWLKGYRARCSESDTEITFTVLNGYTEDTLRRMNALLNQKTEQILRTISRNGSDYDKVLQIHDYLIQHTYYDKPKERQGRTLCHTAYGCLVNGRAVCQGYSEAFQLIMQKLRIECGTCSGETKRGRHTWNYVKVNQQYYWIDVTWDDPRSENTQKSPDDWIHHEYFLINDEILLRSRKFDKKQQFRPVCRSLRDNYFVKNQAYLTKYHFTDINALLTKHVREGRAEIMFSSKRDLQSAYRELFEKEKIFETDILHGRHAKIRYSVNETMYALRIWFETC